jgi:hypothetical protein
MARSHARISVAVWGDPDYATLTIRAQWLYAHLLAHPRLSLVGTIDLSERRWARLAADAAPEDIEAALSELEAARMLLIDWDTEEVMVRTFTSHDLSPGRVNRNLAAGFWRSWEGVLSPDLRSSVAHAIPEELWDRLEEFAPPAAVHIRRSPRLEPEPRPRLEPQVAPRSQPTPTPTPPPTPPSSPVSGAHGSMQSKATEACEIVGRRSHEDAVETGVVKHRDNHLAACVRSAVTDHLARAQTLAHENPGWSPSLIADRLMRQSVPLEESTHPAVVAQRLRGNRGSEEPVASQEAVASAAADARARLAEVR